MESHPYPRGFLFQTKVSLRIAFIGRLFNSPVNKNIPALLATLLIASGFIFAADPAFKVEIDYSTAPACEAFATKSKALVEEWYPKINEVLFDKNHPLPVATVRLKFEPMKGVAHATGDGIHISEDWVTKKAPNDYGMVVHELTHVVQHYGGKGEGWLTEGIADYIRHKYFEKDIEKIRPNPDKSSYNQAYTTAAAFLFWLEQHKDKEIVRKLNLASNDGTYSRELFTKYCGADVDALWKEFTDSLRVAK